MSSNHNLPIEQGDVVTPIYMKEYIYDEKIEEMDDEFHCILERISCCSLYLFSYLIWSDSFVSADRITELKPFQRINHFPGMVEVTRKDCLARNMIKIQRHHADEFNFVPKSWILPADFSMLQNYAKDLKAKKKYKTFIVKPSNGAQGHGIQLYRNAEKIPPSEHFIVQEYIDKPLLLEGYKFDLRIYVLVTSCDPLRIFIFNDGLVRMSTDKYTNPSDGNLGNLFMHLTNYSVNKHNEFYQKGDSVETGSKRSIRYFNDYLRKNDYDIVLLWRRIYDMVVKTLLVAHPHLLHAYRMCRPGAPAGSDSVCFEVLGFDVLIDRKLNPWLLEINRSPSFGTDEKIDFDIKSALIEDTIRLLNINTPDQDNDQFKDGNCAAVEDCGWWFNDCYVALLNGLWGRLDWIHPWHPTVESGRYVKRTTMM
ncbi:tubulin polyglutamylase TTLL7-like, partial [Saccostrea cucullata]|uniref:tubulin polyglutamylase TTLL7-like n=1 Tax=Saccostrea cuccullata TaxID=36930 RepID=UPI002ED1D709